MDNSVFLDDDDLGHIGNDSPVKGQSRTWMLLLWPDDPSHANVIENTLPDSGWDFVGMCHDKEKKLHHHIVFYNSSPKFQHQIAEKLALDARWIRKWDSKKKAFRYLAHRDNPQKFQYDVDGLYGTLTEDAIKACKRSSNESEVDDALQIVKFLESFPFELSTREAIAKFCELGVYSSFRRMGALGVKLLKEHNEFYRMRFHIADDT